MNTREKVSFITLSEKKKAPKVGTYIEHKNAIIIKKHKGNKIEVYYTDQNGLVMKATQGGGGNPENVENVIKSFLEENSITIRNSLNLTPSRVAEFSAWDMDIVFRHNDAKKTISAEDIPLLKRDRDSGIVYHYGKEDRLEIRGEDYPNEYVLIRGRNIIIGKNIVDVVPIVYEGEEIERYNGRNQYVLNAIQAEQIINRPINFTFQENGAPIEDLGIEFINAIKFSQYSDDYDLKKPIKTGSNILYSIDGKLQLRVMPVEGQILEISSNGQVLYSGMPNSQYSPIEIVDNIRDIEVNLRDERVGQGNVNFMIEDNVGGDFEISNMPKFSREDLKKIITNGDNEVFYREVGESYVLSIRNSGGSNLTRLRVTIKDADTERTITEDYSYGYSEALDISTPISKDINRIKIVIDNN